MIINKQKVKQCTWCKEIKGLSEFYYSEKSAGRDNYYPQCIKCDNEKSKRDRKTKKGLIYEIYRHQKKRIKNDNVLYFTRDQFYEWFSQEKLFLELYNSWVNNNYNQDLKPACYKIDFDLPFRMDNIAIATSKQVADKYNEDIRTGKNHTINNKTSKPVNQYTKDGIFERRHHSIHAAERYLQEKNNDKRQYNTSITACKNGRAKSAHGYIWKEDTTPIEKTKFGEKIDVKHLNNYLIEDIENILGSEIIIDTEKENLIKCRIGQGKFRDQLIEYWNGCSVTGFKNIDLLVASHIKPWRNSSNKERLDVYNGLLLTPNLDKLFDKGYISFSDNGGILISDELSEYNLFGISTNIRIAIDEKHQNYLLFHRENIYKK
jgi:hypothetical protein